MNKGLFNETWKGFLDISPTKMVFSKFGKIISELKNRLQMHTQDAYVTTTRQVA